MSSTPSGGVPAPIVPAAAPFAPDAPDGSEAPDLPTRARGPAISEDWLATIAGLVILGLVLMGAITRAMIP